MSYAELLTLHRVLAAHVAINTGDWEARRLLQTIGGLLGSYL